MKNEFNYNKWFEAAYDEDIEKLQEFLNLGINIDYQSKRGETALMTACNVDVELDFMYKVKEFNDVNPGYKSVKFLLENGANSNEQDFDGRTPFIIMMINSPWYDIAIELLKYKADVSIEDYKGNTIFDYEDVDFLKTKEIQELICELQPQNVGFIKNSVLPEIKQKYKYLFDAESAGLL